MVRDELSVLSAFLMVAEERSFTRAAKQLSVSPSALSHAIRGLEERLGVRLLGADNPQRSPDRSGRAVRRPAPPGASRSARRIKSGDGPSRPASRAGATRDVARSSQ